MIEPVYDDTLKYGIVSKQENKYGQAYCNSYDWICCHTMAQKSLMTLCS